MYPCLSDVAWCLVLALDVYQTMKLAHVFTHGLCGGGLWLNPSRGKHTDGEQLWFLTRQQNNLIFLTYLLTSWHGMMLLGDSRVFSVCSHDLIQKHCNGREDCSRLIAWLHRIKQKMWWCCCYQGKKHISLKHQLSSFCSFFFLFFFFIYLFLPRLR